MFFDRPLFRQLVPGAYAGESRNSQDSGHVHAGEAQPFIRIMHPMHVKMSRTSIAFVLQLFGLFYLLLQIFLSGPNSRKSAIQMCLLIG